MLLVRITQVWVDELCTDRYLLSDSMYRASAVVLLSKALNPSLQCPVWHPLAPPTSVCVSFGRVGLKAEIKFRLDLEQLTNQVIPI